MMTYSAAAQPASLLCAVGGIKGPYFTAQRGYNHGSINVIPATRSRAGRTLATKWLKGLTPVEGHLINTTCFVGGQRNPLKPNRLVIHGGFVDKMIVRQIRTLFGARQVVGLRPAERKGLTAIEWQFFKDILHLSAATYMDLVGGNPRRSTASTLMLASAERGPRLTWGDNRGIDPSTGVGNFFGLRLQKVYEHAASELPVRRRPKIYDYSSATSIGAGVITGLRVYLDQVNLAVERDGLLPYELHRIEQHAAPTYGKRKPDLESPVWVIGDWRNLR